MIPFDVRMNFRDVKVGRLGAFAALDDERGADQFQLIAQSGEVSLDGST